jgi:frataxin
MPDSEDPAPPTEIKEAKPTTPTEIDDDHFHMHADQFLNSVHEKAEQIQEGREDVEVDYSVSITHIYHGR